MTCRGAVVKGRGVRYRSDVTTKGRFEIREWVDRETVWYCRTSIRMVGGKSLALSLDKR